MSRLTLKEVKSRGRRAGALQTPLGKDWSSRLKGSENYFKDYSYDWEQSLTLLSGFKEMEATWGHYVSMAYAVTANLVNDVYFQNPKTFVQDKAGNKDLSAMLTDVFNSVARDTGLERHMKDAIFDNSWAGFGVVWSSFYQEGYENPLYELDAVGEPLSDPDSPDGAPLPRIGANGKEETEYVATAQRILSKRVSPWRIGFDPLGREADLSDHRWMKVDYSSSVREIIEDESFDRGAIDRFCAWYSTTRFGDSEIERRMALEHDEQDAGFLQVRCVEIWDRVNKTIIYMPAGANFHLGEKDWGPAFRKHDEFPCEYISFFREPEDKEDTRGFIGLPIVRMIRPQLTAINRLESLFIEANTHVINKYLMAKGFLEEQEQNKLLSDKNREVIQYTHDALAKFPGGASMTAAEFDVRKILMLVPQGEVKEMRHLEGIAHELNVIAQILGQSTGDRGGLAEADSATEALGLQRRLEQRLKTMRAEAGRHYDAINRKYFLILKEQQTLPVHYQMTTQYNEKVWDAFNADDLKELDLHFEHAADSSAPRTAENEISLRRQVAEVLLPIFSQRGDTRSLMALSRMLVEPLGVVGLEQFFNDEVTAIAQELLKLMDAVNQGEVDITDPNVAAKQMELTSALVSAVLTDQDIAAVADGGAGAPPPPTGGNAQATADLPAEKTAGEMAAQKAAAGMVGGLA